MKNVISSPNAPAAVGTYSHGYEYNGLYFFSGQIGLNPKTAELAIGFDAQLEQVLKNIDALLESVGLNRSHVIKNTVFLLTMDDFPKVNSAYEKYFSKPYPARSTVAVSALPKGALVEIEIIAAK